LSELQSLEVELHSPAARKSRDRLNALLHADYLELGRSGRRYTKANVLPDGAHERHTLRTSIWQWTEQGWQMRFHQGTPTQFCSPQ